MSKASPTPTIRINASAARTELIAIQKRWVEELKQQIYQTETRVNPTLDAYYEEYRENFRHGFEKELSRDHISKALSKADIAYFGDYHTLKLAQTTYASLVDEMVTEYDREVVLALEMVESKYQLFIDDFLAERISESEFLRSIQYEHNWGFPWAHYKRIFDVARRHKLRVIGINLNADGRKRSLYDRDRHAARLIAALRVIHPRALVAVLFGDLHVGESHLPKIVKKELQRLCAPARQKIFYQNSETLYWELVAKGHEGRTDAVRIRPNVYCIMNATPLTKFQSWAGWMDRDVSVDEVPVAGETNADLSGHFQSVLETLEEFIGVDAEDIDDYTLYTTHDLNFLTKLANSANYTAEDVAHMREMIIGGRSVVIAETRTLYLSSMALNESAWLAARFLRLCYIGVTAFTEHHEPRDAFYVSIFEEALGTIGTLIMNPRYRVMTPKDHEDLLFNLRGRRRLTAQERLDRTTSRYFLQHRDMIAEHQRDPKSRSSLRAIYKLEAKEYLALTRAIGRLLGAALFHGIHTAEVEKPVLVELFLRKWKKGETFDLYLEMAELVGEVPDFLRPISQSL